MKGLAPLGERRSDFYLLGSLVIQRRRQRRRRHRRRRRRRRPAAHGRRETRRRPRRWDWRRANVGERRRRRRWTKMRKKLPSSAETFTSKMFLCSIVSDPIRSKSSLLPFFLKILNPPLWFIFVAWNHFCWIEDFYFQFKLNFSFAHFLSFPKPVCKPWILFGGFTLDNCD